MVDGPRARGRDGGRWTESMVDDEGAGMLMMKGIYLSASTLDRPLSVPETILGKGPT